MTLFPMFMKLEGRSCLVVGAGTVGEPKISSLIATGATVRVIAPRGTTTVAELASTGAITWECNVVDDPEYCDFYYPAVVRRGDLQVAISTNGHSPALAQRIRRELEIQFGPEYGEWLEELGRIRQQLFASKLDPEERRRLLHELAGRAAFEAAKNTGFNVDATSLEKMS
jgi:precorrin-2 dehydrogenase / sirohydrochlorin ferrochelatase